MKYTKTKTYLRFHMQDGQKILTTSTSLFTWTFPDPQTPYFATVTTSTTTSPFTPYPTALIVQMHTSATTNTRHCWRFSERRNPQKLQTLPRSFSSTVLPSLLHPLKSLFLFSFVFPWSTVIFILFRWKQRRVTDGETDALRRKFFFRVTSSVSGRVW